MLTPDPLHGDDPRRLGPFEILGRLGAGGMGQVFLGRDGAGRLAAVKVVHEGLASDPQFLRRFAREISTARAARAPWTAAVVAADPDGPRPWLATEYVDGPSLDQVVESAGPLRESAVGILAARLSQALAGLHAIGIVHRDLKPSNVLLADDGPRLIDFGIARAVDSTKITHTGAVVGTPAFMSPEQANGDDVGAPSDVYSLAAVVAYAATGRGPFGHTPSPVAMLMRVIDGEPDVSGVPAAVRERLEPCLHRDPAARPTAAALADRLAPLDREKPARAAAPTFLPSAYQPPHPGPVPPVAPARRTRPWLVAGGVAAAVALVVTLVVLLVPRGAAVTATGDGNPDRPAALALPGSPRPPATPATEVGTVPVGQFPDDVALSPDGTRAYVLDSRGVSVIDTATRAVVTTIMLPGGPTGVAVSADGMRVYFSTSSGFVAVFDTGAGAVTATIPVGDRPDGLTIGGDGRQVHVILADADSVAVIDTATNTVTATVPVDSTPTHIAATPDGSLVYVWSQDRQTFAVIDTAQNAVLGRLPVEQVDGITMAPDGMRAYVLSGLGTVTVLDPAAMSVIGHIRSPLGAAPVGLAVSPDSAHLYVAVRDRSDGVNAVRVLDASSTFVVEEVTLSVEPAKIALSGDGGTLVASSFDATAAVVVDTSGYPGTGVTGPVTAADPAGPVAATTVALGEEPSFDAGIAFSPSGDRTYVTSEAGVVVLETATSTTIGTIATEQGISHLVVDPAGTRAFFSTLAGIEVLDLTTNLVSRVIPSELVYDLLGVGGGGTHLVAALGRPGGTGGADLSRVDLVTGEITPLAEVRNDPSIALTGDGATAYVGSDIVASDSTVTAVDTTTGVSVPVAGTEGVSTLAMGPDGRTLYGIGAIRRVVVDTADNSVVTDERGAPNAGLLAASPTGAHLFAPDRIDGTLNIVTTEGGDVVETLPTGEYPAAIALAPDGRRLHVASRGGLSVLDVTAFP